MRVRYLAVFLAAAAVAAPAARADNAVVRKALQANYDKISAEFRAGDASTMASMLAPDATLTTPNHQTWDRSRILSDFKRQSSMMKDATWSRKVTAVTVRGSEAVATVKGKFHGAFSGQNGTRHTFDLTSLTMDTWVHVGHSWKLKHADTRELNPLIDGKAPPAGMGGHE